MDSKNILSYNLNYWQVSVEKYIYIFFYKFIVLSVTINTVYQKI